MMKKLCFLYLMILMCVGAWGQLRETDNASITGTWTYSKAGVQASFINPAKPLERVEMVWGRLAQYNENGSVNNLFRGYGDTHLNSVIGNVGIGTTNPGSLLNVGTKTTNSPSTIAQFGKSVVNGEASVLSLVNSGGGSNQSTSIEFHNRDSWSSTGKIQLQQIGTDTKSKMHFLTYNSGLKNRMTIDENGFVGIGTTNPVSGLDVNGEIRSGFGGNTGIQLATYYWSGSHGLLFNSYKDILHTDGSLAVNTRYANDAGGYYGGAGSIFFYGNGGTMDFCISPSSTGKDNVVEWGDPKLKIFRNGNVAIGKTTADHKLDVAGTIRAEEILVEAQTADFVFESDYNLRDLSEVENFIKENKHLPEIPSAAQMEKQGVNLAEMNKLLLQKVEELTLYVIEKDKEVKAQNLKLEKVEAEMTERLAKLEALLLGTNPNP